MRAAHLPAYQRLGYPVAGLYDIDADAAEATATTFAVPHVYSSLDDACEVPDAIFDLAVPGDQILSILERLPAGAPVLIQKPMTIIQIGCSQKGLANWVQQIVTGGIIIVAVALDRVRSKSV